MSNRPAFTPEDADRLLEFGDRFLADWEIRALQSDRDADYAEFQERFDEWHAIRPLLSSAVDMLAALEAQQFAEADPQASRYKGYFDRARDMRRAVLIKLRGGTS